ncbi:CHAP domain-containing protein [Sphingobium sp. HBC34]|uniref:CHAP domain-containing protein n=1 Tax=Sphingobium cyanobacteriorum TaxID=3063954 RepID=A0ABT8ZR11_9SPHN|nr:CHAP domain-containing protein [Sphingobium sp. HBC34]MDO7836960.1 CHAP domain-containing protein [Sphingobium sp. HBC34]
MNRTMRWAAMVLLSGLTATPGFGAAVLQCVPYARTVSGVEIRGDALNWWDQAEGQYKRGHSPRKGAVLAFRAYGPMTLGHVAVVSRVLDDRRVLIRHANWSAPGAIEEDVLAIDVSEEGDWSQVRVWHSPTGQMGARTNPTYGFIYPAKAKLHDFVPDPALGTSVRFAKLDKAMWDERPALATPVSPRGLMMVQARPAKAARTAVPRLETDMRVIAYADNRPIRRSLSAIIADVRREAVLN